MQVKRKSSQSISRMVTVAMFAAMAYAVMLLIHIKVGFLTMDVKDAVITICGLVFGPVSALILCVIVPLLELITVSDTGWYGLIMNVLGSTAFSVTASLFYKWKKTLWGAICGLLSGVLVMTAVMMLANLFITPYYMGTTMAAVRQLIPTLLLPFNLLKGMINAGAVLLLYKPLSRALHKVGVLTTQKHNTKGQENCTRPGTKSAFSRKSLFVSLAAALLITGSLILIFTVLGGNFDFGVG